MSLPIAIPVGARVIETDSFLISTYSHHDTLVETVVLDVNGHGVQINRYDGDDTDVIVSVDGCPVQMGMDDVDTFISNNT